MLLFRFKQIYKLDFNFDLETGRLVNYIFERMKHNCVHQPNIDRRNSRFTLVKEIYYYPRSGAICCESDFIKVVVAPTEQYVG